MHYVYRAIAYNRGRLSTQSLSAIDISLYHYRGTGGTRVLSYSRINPAVLEKKTHIRDVDTDNFIVS